METTTRCSICQKSTGAYFCTGCKSYFCMKDLKNHHETLLSELDVIVEDRNEFQEKLNKVAQQNHFSSPLFMQIDDWQRSMTDKVAQAADQVRQQLIEVLDSKRSEVINNFEKFSKDLLHLKETEDLYHDDLTRLQQTLYHLQEALKQLLQVPYIELHTEQSSQISWNRLIYIEEKFIKTVRQPTTGKLSNVTRIIFLN